MSKDLLTVKNYSVSSGSVSAVRQVDFKVSENEKLGIVGESGAGKSMLGLSLMGLLPFGWESTGSAELAGREVASARRRQPHDSLAVRARDGNPEDAPPSEHRAMFRWRVRGRSTFLRHGTCGRRHPRSGAGRQRAPPVGTGRRIWR